MSAGSQCRAPSGECDLGEYCNGQSSECPTDVYVQDGSQCSNNGVSHTDINVYLEIKIYFSRYLILFVMQKVER